MLSQEYVIDELSRIANMLMQAERIVEWGGQDEARDGEPGFIDSVVKNTLEELAENKESYKLEWLKDESRFNLSGDIKKDYKGKKVKTWFHAVIPGKFDGKKFNFNIERDSKVTKYYFEMTGKKSQIMISRSKIKELFNNFFEISQESTVAFMNNIYDQVVSNKSEIHKRLKSFLSFAKATGLELNKYPEKHYFYIKVLIDDEDVKEDQKAEMSKDDLDKVNQEVKKFISSIDGADISKIKISSRFDTHDTEDVSKWHELHIALKF